MKPASVDETPRTRGAARLIRGRRTRRRWRAWRRRSGGASRSAPGPTPASTTPATRWPGPPRPRGRGGVTRVTTASTCMPGCACPLTGGRLERFCRYALRPPVAQERLHLTAAGHVRLTLKSPWADGTPHLEFEPIDLLGRLAALTPRPRINLVLYHGMPAPRAAWRALVIRFESPDRSRPEIAVHPDSEVAGDPGAATEEASGAANPPPADNHHWTALMRRSIDVLACPCCGGRLALIGIIDDPAVVPPSTWGCRRRSRSPVPPGLPRCFSRPERPGRPRCDRAPRPRPVRFPACLIRTNQTARRAPPCTVGLPPYAPGESVRA